VGGGGEGWVEDAWFERFRRAWPYRNLKREDFDAVIALHTDGRRGLLHRDGVGGGVMARKRAGITALTGGGAIPDVADYRVVQDPAGGWCGAADGGFGLGGGVGG